MRQLWKRFSLSEEYLHLTNNNTDMLAGTDANVVDFDSDVVGGGEDGSGGQDFQLLVSILHILKWGQVSDMFLS
jgi:hypothetical protein